METGYCQRVAEVCVGSSTIYNGCMEMEQKVHDNSKSCWSGIPPRMRNYCHEVGKVGGGSDSILKGCIDMESDATSSTLEFKY
ncbi:hypothetical protein NKJ28_26695 [Mesorhizobium sp. M0145]|uniref:hypothetical protein n=1 Tax=unclassified Mesorhizobium TaxID=325217 RepID=UPI003336571F